MTRFSLRWLLLAALCLPAAACGANGDGDPADAGAADTPVDTDAGETSTDVAATDTPPDDGGTGIDTGPALCVPGQRRCLTSGAQGYDLCGDEGEWVTFFCDENEVCFDGFCNPPVCEPFEVESCTDCRNYIGCNGGGTAIGEFPVPVTMTCVVSDEGVAELIDSTCVPNSTRCEPDSDRNLERCDECGQEWVFATDCFDDDETTVCDLGECIAQCEFIRKRDTYIGCEYWAVDLDNAFVPAGGGQYIDADGKPFAVVLSNPSENVTADVTVRRREGLVHETAILPGDLEVVTLHHYANASDRTGTPLSDIQGTMIGSEAFRIESTMPIIAYQFNPLDNETVYSNDASLLFPTSSLGQDYWVMTRRQTFDSLKGYVTVVAVLEGETDVTVTLPEHTPENPLVTLSGVNVDTSDPIPPLRGGQSMSVTLQQYQVLNIETNRPGADLTGTLVEANRSVAVFGGSEASNAPNDDDCVFRPSFDDWVCAGDRRSFNPTPCVNDSGDPDITLCSDFITCCADHLEHQMLPDFAWGRSFNATRSVPRGDEADSWRILASRDGTRVNLIGLPDTWPLPGLLPSPSRREFELGAGEWVDFQSPVDFEISASAPIMVGQFLAAEFAPYPQSIDAEQPPHSDAGTGDPAFILAVPAEQYRTEYTFLAPNAFEFDYVTVTAPEEAEVRIDGDDIESEDWEDFGRGDFKVARLPITDGVHTLDADLPVGLTVHGYDSFVSYGYPGGLDLRDISDR